MVHTPLARCRYRCLCRSSVRCPLHPFPLLFLSLSFLSPSFSISFIHFLGQSQSVGVGKVQLHAAFLAATAAALLLARQSPTRHALHRRPKEGMMLDTEELERKRRGGQRTNKRLRYSLCRIRVLFRSICVNFVNRTRDGFSASYRYLCTRGAGGCECGNGAAAAAYR